MCENNLKQHVPNLKFYFIVRTGKQFVKLNIVISVFKLYAINYY